MKNSHSCTLFLAFFTTSLFGLVSCSGDEDFNTENDSNDIIHRIANELPGNASNPYDEAGWLHNELFETYYASVTLPRDISAIATKVETIAEANTGFKAIKGSAYLPVSTTRVQYIIDHRSTCITDVISASSMTAPAKLSLTNFISSLVVLFDSESNCDILYRFVVDYEDVILNDKSFSAKDMQIMLTTTSIARHVSYLAKKRPKKNTDPDWTILVTNVVAAADRAEYGMAESITTGLVAGIVQNN